MASKKATGVSRIYSGEEQVDTDTFKLEVAKFKKNISLNDRYPDWQFVEHAHFFHTFDSQGKKMVKSSMVGGHCHLVDVKEVDGEFVVTCGAACDERGKPLKTGDDHVHEVKYLKSDKLKIRSLNQDAAKIIAAKANAYAVANN